MCKHAVGMFVCLSAETLRAAGWTSHQIREAQSCCLRRVRHGVYVVVRVCDNPRHAYVSAIAASDLTDLPKETKGMRKQNEDLQILVRSYERDLPPQATLSHRSAMIAHGLPVPFFDRGEHPIAEAVHPTYGVRHRSLHVRLRELAPGDCVIVGGARATSLLRTLADVARDYPRSFAVAVLDFSIHQGLTTAEAVRAYAEQHPFRTNQRKVDAALELMDGRRESVSESICAVRFVEHSIVGFVPQVTIRDADGDFVARTDFADEKAKVIAEFDGAGKYYLPGTDPKQAFELERHREYRLRNLGYSVFRIRWQDLFSADIFLKIKDRVARSLAVRR